MDITCSAEPCPIVLNATCVFYEGDNLIYTGINNNDNLQTALQKIDQKFQDAGLGYIFSNGIEQLVPGGAVMLGGALNKNTTIGGLYNLAFAGTLEASALITTGGTSTDFVKGDGSLDPTSYQPAGNYITNLTGDVLASGPGSVAATLATVFGAPGTYGNAGNVPSITVDGKGRITNVTPIPINYPAQSLSFVGDVEGLGFTGSPVTLTLDTVNTDVYGSNNFLKFAVNGKGLITSATPVSGGDITTALGYVPVNDAIELTINGVAHDLTANRDWNVGTVTTVGVSAGTGISASVSNPNTNPVINIVNTAPDQTVRLNAGFGISISGSYPNFTITNDYPDLPNEGVTSVSAGNLSPLFTTSVTDPTTTPALSFALSSAAANTVFAGPDGGAGAPTYRALVAADLPSLSYISNISTTAPLATTGGLTPTLSISQADSTTDGYLSSADWTTFNSKQAAGNYITDLTGDATASGPGSACLTLATVNATGGTFGSSTQVPVITVNGKGLVTCVTTDTISGSLEFVGDVTGVGSTGTCTSLTLATVNTDVFTSETLLNIAVNGKGLITSANPTTAGDICSTLGYTPENVANKSTCTSLGTSNTLYPTQLAVKTYVDSATAGGIILQGDWNANTNTPDITGTTTTGFAWRVSVSGTTNLGGITDWQVGDLAVKSATGWVKIDNTENVTSVFGRFGAIVATTGDYLSCQVTECGNLYYTDARVRAAVGHTAPLTYNSATGVFGISQSNATTDGYLSATDWTTFNDKQPALGYTPVNQTRQLTINGTIYDLTADRSWSVGTVTAVTGSAPLASSGGNTPNLTISQAGAASNGYLSSTDWNHFNSHTSCTGTVTNVATCTSTTGVLLSGSPVTTTGTLGINISTASSVCTGLLTAADWNTFNNKSSCLGTVTSVGLTSTTTGVSIGGSPVTSSGNLSLNIATASALCTGLLTSADWNTFNSHTGCTGTVTCVNATGTNISVTGGPITTSGTLAISLSGANVCSALGYTPYNATNPNGYTTCVGTVTSVGIVATNINVCASPVTTSGNICLNLTGANVCAALGYSPAPTTSVIMVPGGGSNSTIRCGVSNTASGQFSAALSGTSNNTSGYGSLIAGGYGNSSSGTYASTIAGGENNVACVNHATIAGGLNNTASGLMAFIGAGRSNTASGQASIIGGGCLNTASAYGTAVGGGKCNRAIATSSTVSGGYLNLASGNNSFVGGGCGNTASVCCSAVVGGIGNTASAYRSIVGGGGFNTASGAISGVFSGNGNLASGSHAVVAGGCSNTASGPCSTIGGGRSNTSNSNSTVIAGGYSNTASSKYAVVGGGFTNTASGNYGSSVLGGYNNTASGYMSIVGGGRYNCATSCDSGVFSGRCNTASSYKTFVGGGVSNTASGCKSTVGGGESNTASGACSIIAGGYVNTANGSRGFVGGGQGNTASGNIATVGGGIANTASGVYSIIGGGYVNNASGYNGTVSGGYCNCASGTQSAVVGGICNRANAMGSFMGGGIGNNTSGGVMSTFYFSTPASALFSMGTAGVLVGGWMNINCGNFGFLGGGCLNRVLVANGTIAGGLCNTVSSTTGTVSGGYRNTASGTYDATVAGGASNTASGNKSTVSGGQNNTASGNCSVVSGGFCNSATTINSFIGGGRCNNVFGDDGTIGGGFNNCVGLSGTWGTVSGGYGNRATGQLSSIGGGYINSGSGYRSSISGGQGNASSGNHSSIGAGINNTSSGNCSTVGGGSFNSASSGFSFVGSGQNNTASGYGGVIVGGLRNTGSGYVSFIGGGCGNTINCVNFGFIGGGRDNTLSGYRNTIVAGVSNNICAGAQSFIGGGVGNSINTGLSSIIGGQYNSTGGGACNVHIIGTYISGCTSDYTYVNNLCQVGGGVSDRRTKNTICDTCYGLCDIVKLRPVSYCWNHDPSNSKKYGFIAQEVQEAIPDIVSYNEIEKVGPDGKRTILGEGDPVLQFEKEAIYASYVNAFKELNEKNQALEARIAALEELIKAK